MKQVSFTEIKATQEEKEEISRFINAVSKGQPLAFAAAWLLWISCATVNKSDRDQVNACVKNGLNGIMNHFIGWLTERLVDPDQAPEIVYEVRIGRGATWAHVQQNDGKTITWQVPDAPQEKEYVSVSGWDLKGFGLGRV